MLSESKETGSGLLFALRDELDRWLGSVRGGNGTWSPATDRYVDEGELYVEVELPGVDAGDVEILTEGSELTVRAVTSDAQPPRGAELQERRRGTYERKYQIPLDWDPTSAHATLKDGVLTLRIPRAPEPEGARRIELKSTAGTTSNPIVQPAPVASHSPIIPPSRPEPLADRPNGNGLPRPGNPGFLVPSVVGGPIEKDKPKDS